MTQNARSPRLSGTFRAGGGDRIDLGAIKDRIDLEAVTTTLLGPAPGRRGQRGGGRLWWSCPFHQDANPSFCVTPLKRSWRCFGCGATGDAFGLVMRLRNCDFLEAARWLAGQSGVSVGPARRRLPSQSSPPSPAPIDRGVTTTWAEARKPPSQGGTPTKIDRGVTTYRAEAMKPPPEGGTPTKIDRGFIVDLVEAAAQRLWTPAGRPALESLYGRGLTDTTIRRARLGFSPPVTELADRPRGIVIPWFDRDALVLVKLRQPGGRRPKYRELFRDRARLYPDPLTIRADRPLVMVEGEFDALLLGQELGDLAAVVTLGSASGRLDRHTEDLLLVSPSWFIATDHDAAGNQAAARWPARARRVVPPDPHKDWTEAFQHGADLAHYWRGPLGHEVTCQMAESLGPDERESREERAAIMEYDGGLPRDEAERAAGLRCAVPSFSCPCQKPGRLV